MLLGLVHGQGAHNWVRISQILHSRSPKQCRERFHQNLKPSLNHEPISPEEGIVIERLVGEMGKRWAEIARRLRGRSDNAVKNWWNGGMNRRRRLVGRRNGSNCGGRMFDERAEQLSFARPVSRVEFPMKSLVIPASRRSGNCPLVSPISSEASIGDSLGDTPSLMSDRGSDSSTSPKMEDCLRIEKRCLDEIYHTQRLLATPPSSTTKPASVPQSYWPHFCDTLRNPEPTHQPTLEHLATLASQASPVENCRKPRKSSPGSKLESVGPVGVSPSPNPDPKDTRMNIHTLLS